MGILVIEGGSPNGTDFVMGAHHGNQLAQAKVNGQRIIKAVDLGDGYAMAGVRLEVAFDTSKENLCVLLVVDAGRNSPLVGLQSVPTAISEVGRISIAELKAGIAEALSPSQPMEQAQ